MFVLAVQIIGLDVRLNLGLPLIAVAKEFLFVVQELFMRLS